MRESQMKRPYAVFLATVVIASCSSTDKTPDGGGGAAGMSAAGSSGTPNHAGSAGHSGGAGGLNAAGQGGTSAAGTSGSGGKGGAFGTGGGSGVAGAYGGGAGVGGSAGSAAAGGGGKGGAAGGGGASGAAGGGGKGGASGNGGSAGAAGGPAKYCDTHPLSPAPIVVTERFDFEDVGDSSQVLEYAVPSVCDEAAVANAVGSCGEWKYTPDATSPSVVRRRWISDPIGVKYAPVCMAAGMTRVTFAAKGNVGGEKVSFGASQATPIEITLTTTWTQYAISLTGVNYNTDAQGVLPGFFWLVDPVKNTGAVRFAVDDIKYVNN